MIRKIKEYISSHWSECIRENMHDDGTLIGLPYPYCVPAAGHFDELYYWDTYFTNIGLILDGKAMLAKNNTDNMLYMVNKYGYYPNGNRTFFLDRSQPPFLSVMVRDIYKYYNDKVWLSSAYETLKKEYDFWNTKRILPTGLNFYNPVPQPEEAEELAEDYARRVSVMPEGSAFNIAHHYLVVCESGWDSNPRWGFEGYNYAPVDLNSLMYAFETNMSFFSKELDRGEEAEWIKRAEKRQKLMEKYMLDESGIFMDLNFKTGAKSTIFSVASLYPMFCGMASEAQAKAAVEKLDRLIAPFGLFTCEKNDFPGTHQWNYPIGWACMHHIAFTALDKYGFKDIARLIASKYISLVEKTFAETGRLWEKYNVLEGSLNVVRQSTMPPMMGWSAGTFLSACDYLNK